MINRRSLLRAAAAAAVGAPLLAGCATVTRSTDLAALNRPATLPTYRRFEGPPPDLPRVHPLMPDAYRRFPQAPMSVVRGVPADGEPITGTTKTASPIPPTADRNSYWQELNRRLGAPLQLNIASAGDYPNKFATAVAGDALGDVFNLHNFAYRDAFPHLPQFLEACAQDLSEHLSGDAVLDYPFLANIPTEAWQGCVVSGAIRAVPVPRGVLSSMTLYCRKDIFDEAGVDVRFGSVDELIANARALTDPRRNRWGLAMVPAEILAQMVGLPNTWDVRGGRLVNENELDEHKELLAIGARLVAEGVVHPDGVTAPKVKDWFNQGSAAMTQDSYSAMPGFLQQNAGNPAFEVALPVIPGPDGNPGRAWLGQPTDSITALRPGPPERIRTLLRVLDWCAAPFGTEEYLFRKFGLPGRHHELRDGDPVLTDLGNSEVALGAFPIQYFTDCPMPLYYAGHPQAVQTVYDNLAVTVQNAIQSPVYGLHSPTQSARGTILREKLSTASRDIYLGRAPVSSWDDVMADWRRSGGDKIRDEYERAMATRNGP